MHVANTARISQRAPARYTGASAHLRKCTSARSRTCLPVRCSSEPAAVNPFAASPAAATASVPKPAGRTGSSGGGSSQMPYTKHTWKWRGYKINYVTAGCGDPILLVHGFGLSSFNFRRNIPVLAKKHKVYAIDLLGFGRSSKPQIQFSMELWRDLIVDFMAEHCNGSAGEGASSSTSGTVLIGNSIGALACLMANAAAPAGAVRGTVLLNTAGAMNNKGVIAGDWRLLLLYPVLLFIDFLLSIPALAAYLFNNLRDPETISKALKNVYKDPSAIDNEYVAEVARAATDPGAREVFVSVITGPPGPKPMAVMPDVKGPLLMLWGTEDLLTPADGPVGKYLQALPASRPDTSFVFLEGAGHLLHDDMPDRVHEHLLPWLDALPRAATSASTSAVNATNTSAVSATSGKTAVSGTTTSAPSNTATAVAAAAAVAADSAACIEAAAVAAKAAKAAEATAAAVVTKATEVTVAAAAEVAEVTAAAVVTKAAEVTESAAKAAEATAVAVAEVAEVASAVVAPEAATPAAVVPAAEQ